MTTTTAHESILEALLSDVKRNIPLHKSQLASFIHRTRQQLTAIEQAAERDDTQTMLGGWAGMPSKGLGCMVVELAKDMELLGKIEAHLEHMARIQKATKT